MKHEIPTNRNTLKTKTVTSFALVSAVEAQRTLGNQFPLPTVSMEGQNEELSQGGGGGGIVGPIPSRGATSSSVPCDFSAHGLDKACRGFPSQPTFWDSCSWSMAFPLPSESPGHAEPRGISCRGRHCFLWT